MANTDKSADTAALATTEATTTAVIETEDGQEYVDHGGFGLPPGIDPKDFVRDPSRRAGHWYHAATDQVFSLPAGWKP